MTRLELLKIVVGQARDNGFEFRRWYTQRMGIAWINSDAAFTLLESQRRYYGLLFSHEFASAFWKTGTEITFQVARQTFQRTMPDGSVATITRKPFTRRSTRRDVWRYHLRQMAVAEDPLRYIRKYLRVEEELEEDATKRGADTPDKSKPLPRLAKSAKTKTAEGKSPATKRTARRNPRALPTDLPAFLRRPYP